MSSDEFVLVPSLSGGEKAPGSVSTFTRTTLDDDLGVYVVQYAGQTQKELLATGNIYDNVQGVFSGGTYTLPKMYYPSRRDAVDAYGYLPYKSAVNPTSVALTVSENQTQTTIHDEDFLRGVKKQEIANAPNPVAVEMEHVMSLVQVTLEMPKHIDIKSVKQFDLLGIKTTANYNVGKDTWSGLANPKNVQMTMVSSTGAASEDKSYIYEALVLPQTAPAKFCKIVIEYNNGREQILESTLALAPKFESKKVSKYTLTLDASGILIVKGATVEDWTSLALSDVQPVSNLLRFVIFDQNYSDGLDKVEMSASGKSYICSNATGKFVATPDFTSEFAKSYDAYIPDDNDAMPSGYPYTIDKLALYKGEVKTDIKILGHVPSHGVINIAIMNDQAIIVSDAQIEAWTQEGIKDAVPQSNTIRLHLMDQTGLDGVDKIVMQVGSKAYTSSVAKGKLTLNALAGNAFIKVHDILLPDDNGAMPSSYPYIISKLSFYKGTTLLSNKSAAVIVSSDGMTEVAIYENSVVGLVSGASISGWEKVLEGGLLPINQPVFNILTASFWDYTNAEMKGANKIRVVINGTTYTCSGTKIEDLGGSEFVNQYTFVIPDDANRAPVSYPYTITNITLLTGVDELKTVVLGTASPVITQNNVSTSLYNFAVVGDKDPSKVDRK